MMQFFHDQMDYIFAAYGMSFIVLAMVTMSLGRASSPLPWKWMGVSAALHALNVWVVSLMSGVAAREGLEVIRTTLLAGSCLCLFEFARRGWHAAGGRRLSPWIVVPLVVLAGLGGLSGWIGLNVSFRYAVGLPAGLWAALALFRQAGTTTAGRRPLLVAATAMVPLVVLEYVVGPAAPFFPASVINREAALATLGVPVQIIGTAIALTLIGGLWAHSRALLEHEHPGIVDRVGRRVMAALVAGLVVVLAVGWIATDRAGRQEERQARARLVARAALVAAAINEDRVASLTATEADVASSDYRRLREQLSRLDKAAADVRRFYLMKVVDDRIVCAVDGVPRGDPGHAEPGVAYEQPPEGLLEAMRRGRDLVVGPYKDEYGTFVSVFVPIREPRTGAPVGTLGVDVDASTWDLDVAAHRLPPILITLLVALIVVGFMAVQERMRFAAIRLNESRAKYRSVLENMQDAFFRIDQDGKLVMASPSFARLFGYGSPTEVCGLDLVRDLGIDASQAAEFVSKVKAEGSVTGFDLTLCRSDGRLVEGSANGQLVRDAVQRVIGVEGLLRDVTEERHAALALAKAEERLDLVIKSAGVGTWDWDIVRDVATWDDTLATLYGMTSAEREGPFSRFYETIHPDDHGILDAAVEKALTSEAPYEAEFRVVRPDGSVAYLGERGKVYRDADGTPVRMSGLTWDVTRRTLAELSLREAEERSRLLLESAGDGIVGMDVAGRVTFMNTAAEQMLGFSFGELVGCDLHAAVHYAHADGSPYPAAECSHSAACVDGSESHVDEEVFWRKDGTSLPVEYTARPIRRGDELTGAIVIFRDISERKRAMEQLLQAKREVEAANRELERAIARANQLAAEADAANVAKSEFLANMSHEIRTPMNGIIGMIGLLLGTDLTEEQREYAETVQSSAEALLVIINDILDFSKIEAGKLEMESLDFDLRTTLEDALDLPALHAHEKGLEITSYIAPDVPSAVRGDPGRLRQVLTNLVGNAIKFTDHGEVAVSVDLVSETRDQVTLRFEVRDTGIGIPKEQQGRLFDAFTQADASTTRRFGGTGLGLSISKRLVELMHGSIGVESEPGVGSTFWFTAVLEKRQVEASPVEQEAEQKTASVRGQRVLAVDDNATNRKVLAGMLSSWGCRHEEVDGAEAALAALRKAKQDGDPFRIAILDMMMPGMDGEALGAAIKADPELEDVALVMMTSMGSRGDASRLEELGFAAYLTKPVKQSSLHDCLVAVLDRSAAIGREQPPRIITRHSLAEGRKRRLRILLAEDNEVNRSVALKTLEKMGYRADAVENGAEAITVLTERDYDLVLMDVQMPEMDGMEATRRIRDPQSPVRNHAVPVIALTAHAMAGDREACLAAGMDDYLSKPIRPEELAAVLSRWSRRSPEPSVGLPVGSSSDSPFEASSGGTACDVTTADDAAASGAADDATDDHAADVDEPVFDRHVLLNLLGGDEEAAADIVREFLSDVPQQVAALRAALTVGDVERARVQAHTLKGASANVGAGALRAVAYRAETAAADGDLEALAGLLSDIEVQVMRLQKALNGRGQRP